MKKIMMMALMAAAATTAFAQDALVKEAKKQFSDGQLDAALQTLAPALTSAETADKAAAWNLKNDICYKIFENEYQKLVLKQKADTLKMYEGLINGFLAAEECDKYDVQPNEKGKVKIRFRKGSASRYQNERPQFYNAGIIKYQKNDMKGAIEAWGVYIQSAKSTIFEGIQLPADQYLADATYNTALLSYQIKDYDNAIKFANLAAQIPGKEDQANEIMLFAAKENMKTAADSAAYVEKVTALHKANPTEERYFNLLQAYYVGAGDMAKLGAWLDEEAQLTPDNKMVWALKGEVAMNSDKHDDAIAAFKKCLEIDADFVPVLFNTGVCYQRKAMDLQDQLADKNNMISKDNLEKVRAVLKEAEVYLEKARKLDPEREKANWAYVLYRIYYTLNEKDKMAELEAIDPSLAQ